MSLPNHKDFPFILLHKVDSTNNYAMGLVHEGMAQHGTAVFAWEQTKGRGQRNREWISQARSNITVSLVLHINGCIPASGMFMLSKAVALATAVFFNSYAGEITRIKWPNDIYAGDRKAGGILIENVLQGSEWKTAIAGIGLNINQEDFAELAGKAVSLKQITGRSYEAVSLAKELQREVMNHFDLLIREPLTISRDYHSRLYKLNEMVKLRSGSRVFEAQVKEVNDFGQLVARHLVEENFSVGEVEWII